MPFRLSGDDEDYSDVPGWEHVQGETMPEWQPPEVEILSFLHHATIDRYGKKFDGPVSIKTHIKLHIPGLYNPQTRAWERNIDYACTLSKYYAQKLYDLIKPFPMESSSSSWVSLAEDEDNEKQWYISARLAHAIQKFLENFLEIKKEEALRRSEHEKYKMEHPDSADDLANKFVMNQKKISHDFTTICSTLHKRIAALESKLH
jgi:hypothetical protein